VIDYSETLRRIYAGDFDQLPEEDKKRAVDELVTACSLAAAAVALQPIPLVDLPLIMAIQLAMVQGIARIRGYHLDKKSVYEVYRTLRTSFLTHQAAIVAAKLVPTFGWAVSASAAYALTFAFGEVADKYFRAGRKLAPAELRELFKRVYKEKRRDKRSALRRDPNLPRELAEVERARQRGEFNDEQVAQRREDLLRRV
jgi:uncharacterized protein (DUF697 family)